MKSVQACCQKWNSQRSRLGQQCLQSCSVLSALTSFLAFHCAEGFEVSREEYNLSELLKTLEKFRYRISYVLLSVLISFLHCFWFFLAGVCAVFSSQGSPFYFSQECEQDRWAPWSLRTMSLCRWGLSANGCWLLQRDSSFLFVVWTFIDWLFLSALQLSGYSRRGKPLWLHRLLSYEVLGTLCTFSLSRTLSLSSTCCFFPKA